MWWFESTFAWTFNGRVLDIGTGRGLQNLDNVGPIPTSLSKILQDGLAIPWMHIGPGG